MNKKWKYERFKGDAAIYALCPKCNFHYDPSRFNSQTFQTDIVIQYKYCPMCGEYLYDDSENVDATWNERDISELYEQA